MKYKLRRMRANEDMGPSFAWRRWVLDVGCSKLSFDTFYEAAEYLWDMLAAPPPQEFAPTAPGTNGHNGHGAHV